LSFYTLSLKEWNLDSFMYRFLWQPLKKAGNLLSFINNKVIFYFFIPLFLVCLFGVYHKTMLPFSVLRFTPEVLSFLALMMILKGFTERKSAMIALLLVVLNQLFISLSVGYNENFDFSQVHLYLSGIIVSGVIAYFCLRHLAKKGENISLESFHGHSYEYAPMTTIFLIACLGLAGFPITPTFIGEDLLLGHIEANQLPLTLLTALNFILDGLVIFRIYSRIFLGQHEKMYHEVAYRSS
jgi:NADH-quinone oxidoreductase subunit L